MAQTLITLGVSLPWWWRFYVWALYLQEYTIGGVNPEIAADFIVRRSRFYSIDAEGRRSTLKKSV